MRKLLMIGIIALLTGCGQSMDLGDSFNGVAKNKEDKALVYLYRTPGFIGSAISYDVLEDGKYRTTLVRGGYYAYYTTPGMKLMTATTESEERKEYNFQANQTYFIKGGLSLGLVVGRPTLELMNKEEAVKELRECKWIINKK